MKIIFLGAPGSGKGTQSEKLNKDFGYQVITASNLLREYAQSGSEIGKQIKEIMGSGNLVDAKLVWQVMSAKIDELSQSGESIILDGYPRSIEQLNFLNADQYDYDHLVYFEISTDVLVDRVGGRRVHMPSGRVYHVDYAPPKVADRDDVTGELLVHRKDDQPEVVKKRMQTYKESTLPIIDVVQTQIAKGQGRVKKVSVINADQAIDKVTIDIERLFK
ncbi:MAG: nucleoside monophosphate kinase [Pseudomonadota bacterium]|nr:nucleoside monophosphate kinase [Pseudomonadota bacterium]